MPAYVIVNLDIRDPEGIKDYQKHVPETIQAFGGRYLVRGGSFDTLEGALPAERVVVLEFPDSKTAKAWYESPAYQGILPLRLRHSTAKFFTVVEGV